VCIRFLCRKDLLCASSTSQRRRWKEKKGEREKKRGREGERGKLRQKKRRKERVVGVSCFFPVQHAMGVSGTNIVSGLSNFYKI